MILTEKKKNRVDSGLEAQDFKIQASSKAFEILSSGLYNNREKAVVRELMCNAYDAHVAVGKKDIPFDVILPTRIEPYLIIKDYGTGLSEDDIYELYTTYFSSDKTDSNMFVGALGLGSKSPFSITDQFTVKSRFNGIETTYLCSISQSGTPQVSKVFETGTEEENGLTVQVSISEDRISKIHKEIRSVIKPFDIIPNIENYDSSYGNIILYKDQKKKVEGKGWFWLSTDYNNGSDIAIIQGNVEYPVNLSDVIQDQDKLDFFRNAIDRYDEKIVIYFPLGTLNIAANREDLSLDKRTLSNINKRLDVIRDNIIDSFQKQIDNIENELELVEFTKSFSTRIRHSIIPKLTWKGIPVEEALEKRLPPQLKGQVVTYTEKGIRKVSCHVENHVFPLQHRDYKIFYYDYERGKTKGIQKIKHAIYKSQFSYGIVVYDKRVFDLFIGDIPYTNLSEFEDPAPNEYKAKTGKPEFQLFRSFTPKRKKYVSYRSTYYARDFYNYASHTNKKVICIVSGGNKQSLLFGRKIGDGDIGNFIRYTFNQYPKTFQENFVPVIYKVKKPEGESEEFTTHPNIINIEDIVKTIVNIKYKRIVKTRVFERIQEQVENSNIIRWSRYNHRDDIVFDENKLNNQESPIVKLLSVARKMRASVRRSNNTRNRSFNNEVSSMAHKLDFTCVQRYKGIEHKVRTAYISKLQEEVKNRYPMLQYMNVPWSSDDLTHFYKGVYEYVNLIDKEKI